MLIDWQDAWGIASLLGAQATTSAGEGEGGASASGSSVRFDRRRRAFAALRAGRYV